VIRVEREGEGPAAAPTAEVLEGLNDLLQLDHDAAGAYEVAIEQLEDRDNALQIEGFRRDHQRHIRELNDLILSLGGSPSNEPHATAPLKVAMQRVAAAAGDRALLLAWQANELLVMTKYDAYARRAVFWPAEAKRLVDRNALDEERHYQWVVSVLGSGEGAVDVANRLREGLVQARRLTADARERLTSAAGTAKLRAAEGLEGAAVRLEEFAEENAGGEGISRQAAVGARKAAEGLDTASAFLRREGEGDGRGVRELIEEEVRTHPARGLLATFAVGFVLGRILR
jgi:hypothetical protein